MTKPPFGVLWDMDGVVVDTGEFHYRSWLEALAQRDIALDREQFRATFGMNNEGILRLLLGTAYAPDLAAEISEEKEHLFRQEVQGQVQPLPGVRDWLARLKAQGTRQAIASSAPEANIEAIVAELELRSYFDALVSGAGLPGKPDPATFLRAAEQIGVPPERCIVVEDAVVGVSAARRAGMKCIAVTTTNPASTLADADIVVQGLDTLAADSFSRLILYDQGE